MTFLAMEYYRLIWNRSFEISATSATLCGALVQGLLMAESPLVAIARSSNDASLLVDLARLADARAHVPGTPAYLALHPSNFVIPRSTISGIRFDPHRKWGMGSVPHSGRLVIDVDGGRRREFILLGQQDPAVLISTLRGLGYPVTAA